MFGDVSNYKNVGDWFYLFPAVIVVDLIGVIMTKYPSFAPKQFPPEMDEWYTKFGIVALASDILIILLGIFIARYLYAYIGLRSIWVFIGCLLAVQFVHDILFYLVVIQGVPKGENEVIDLFKSYAKAGGANILVADAMMIVGSVGIASLLKARPADATIFTLFASIYTLTYLIYTRPA
jgi:hypothetical protein